mgnify:CR=1 FL=1
MAGIQVTCPHCGALLSAPAAEFQCGGCGSTLRISLPGASASASASAAQEDNDMARAIAESKRDADVAATYTEAQHNGSVATAKYLIKKKLQLGGVSSMLDVGGGSGAFSYVFVGATPGLTSTILELPEVCRTGETVKAKQTADVQERPSLALR